MPQRATGVSFIKSDIGRFMFHHTSYIYHHCSLTTTCVQLCTQGKCENNQTIIYSLSISRFGKRNQTLKDPRIICLKTSYSYSFLGLEIYIFIKNTSLLLVWLSYSFLCCRHSFFMLPCISLTLLVSSKILFNTSLILSAVLVRSLSWTCIRVGSNCGCSSFSNVSSQVDITSVMSSCLQWLFETKLQNWQTEILFRTERNLKNIKSNKTIRHFNVKYIVLT